MLAHLEQATEEAEQAERRAGPCAMVVFGATGDLTTRKLIPALYNLEKAGLLPKEFAVLGVAIDDISSDEFRNRVTSFLDKEDHGSDSWMRFQKSLQYHKGDITQPDTYESLKSVLAQVDKDFGTAGNYLFYTATAPRFFAEVVRQLGASGRSEEHTSELQSRQYLVCRLLLEKKKK